MNPRLLPLDREPTMSHRTSPALLLLMALVLALAGCVERPGHKLPSELEWARTALQRNPQIEIVAADAQTHSFTLRDRRSGQVRDVKLNDLAAAPTSDLVRAALEAPAPRRQPASPPPAAPAEPTTPAADPAVAQTPAEPPATPPLSAPSTPLTQAASAAETTQTPHEEHKYMIERFDGELRVTGPGVSIVRSRPTGDDEARKETAQRRADPIICEGRRMLHLDNRTLYVEGDAITARGGCELYITNSRIVASGTGIVVRDASVHVTNSHVEGADGSFEASDNGRLFVRASTIQGVPRRTQLADIYDQGGNRWR
jgi:hypothetical protein